MAFSRRMGPKAAVLTALLGIATVVTASTSVPIAYCANLNTASTNANSSIYQSDGLCHDFCLDNFAFAIVQDANCWCTDYTPAASLRVDMSDCTTECPGFPDDICGGPGLWAYIQLSKAAAGTKGGADPTTAAATTTAQGITTTTVQNTVTVAPVAPISSPETASISPTPATTHTAIAVATTKSDTTPGTTDSPTTAAAAATTAQTTAATTFVSTVTQGGSIILQTVTLIPSATNTVGENSAAVNTSQSGLTTGQAVGVAVGVLGFFVLAGALGIFLWLRRKRRSQEQTTLEHQNSLRGSSAGMMSTPRTEMTSVFDSEGQSMGRRNSRLMPHDPRMDPYTANIYNRFENKSRESVNTLRDDQDYSRRVLRTTNPDPSAGE